MWTRIPLSVMPAVLAVYMPMCAARVQPTVTPWHADTTELWQQPTDVQDRDLFYGPWGIERAPDPSAVYTWIADKNHGTNPGVVVTDPQGHEWHVKQPPNNNQGAEGPIEVVLSRVLSAVGYHQPPVYFMNTFTIRDATGLHTAAGGRFRLKVKSLRSDGTWSWQQNPFVGTRPYQGLLVILVMLDSSDLKNANNMLYWHTTGDGERERWFVVKDLGTALGETGRLFPKRGDIDLYERLRFITGAKDGYVQFSYHGWHQELFKHRITPEDVEWASDLLNRLSDGQWMDAFRAGGYDEQASRRFVTSVKRRIAEGYRVAHY